MAYRFPARIAPEEMVRAKQHVLLPGCGCERTFNFWIYAGVLNSSRTGRVKLPSLKVGGRRITTVDAYQWWQRQLQN